MDDYQKQLERQLQQQHLQLRNQTNELNAPRPLQQPLLQQQQQQQRHQPPPPQWTSNLITGAPPPPMPGVPGAPGFGRGMVDNVMGGNPTPQQQGQGITRSQGNAFSSSQTNVQNVQNVNQLPRQTSPGSSSPGSPVPGDTRTQRCFYIY